MWLCNKCLYSSLVGIQKRISQGLTVLQYYTTKNWSFKNEKFLHMMEIMSPADRKRFYFSVEEVRYQFIISCSTRRMFFFLLFCVRSHQMRQNILFFHTFLCLRRQIRKFHFVLTIMQHFCVSIWISRLTGTNILDITFLAHDTFYWKKNQIRYHGHGFCCVACIYWTS